MATVTFPTIVNNAESTLDIAHTNSVTTITLATGGVAALGLTGTTNAIISIITQGTYQQNPETSEIIHVTGDSGDTLTGATRGFDGSSAKAFSAGDIVEVRVVKSHIQQVYDTLNDGTKSISVDAGLFAGNVDLTGDGAILTLQDDLLAVKKYGTLRMIAASLHIEGELAISLNVAGSPVLGLASGGLVPSVTNTIDLGSSSFRYKDLFIAGNGNFAGSVLVKPGGTTPVIAPSDDILTGFFFPANDFMKYLTGGTQSFEINNSGQATFAFQANFDGVIEANAGLTVTGTTSIAQESWTAVTYDTNWADLGSYQGVEFMKDSMGFVHIRGSAVNTVDTGAVNMFTLPVGYRPPARLLEDTLGNTTHAFLDLQTSGVVRVAGGSYSANISVNVTFFVG